MAESKTNDLVNNNEASLSENSNQYDVWKQFPLLHLKVKLL